MKERNWNRLVPFLVMLMAVVPLLTTVTSSNAYAKKWVTAYAGGWWFGNKNNGTYPMQNINYKGMTVCDHMALIPTISFPFIDSAMTNGWVTNNFFLQNSLDLTSYAHAAGIKCTFTIGAWATEGKFLVATNKTNLPKFVSSLVGFLKERHYDGVDIDWEPMTANDSTQYKNFVIALRDSLPSPYIITVTTYWGAPYSFYASIQDYVDQINIMSYDIDTDAPGYRSWYASSVYSSGFTDPFDNKTPVPSCNYLVNLFEKDGVKPSKLGIGCEPGGDLWTGISGPNQDINRVSSWTEDISYNTIMKDYYKPSLYHWDNSAKASYLSYVDSTDSTQDWFMSYDDTTALKAKLAYIDSAGLGGLIFYEIGMCYNDSTHDNPFLDVFQRYLENSASAVNKPSPNVPKTLALSQNYPNPFNPTTKIDYSVAKRGPVSLAVYNVLGEKVATLYSGEESPGTYSATFDGARLASGVYFYRLRSAGAVITKKLVLLK